MGRRTQYGEQMYDRYRVPDDYGPAADTEYGVHRVLTPVRDTQPFMIPTGPPPGYESAPQSRQSSVERTSFMQKLHKIRRASLEAVRGLVPDKRSSESRGKFRNRSGSLDQTNPRMLPDFSALKRTFSLRSQDEDVANLRPTKTKTKASSKSKGSSATPTPDSSRRIPSSKSRTPAITPSTYITPHPKLPPLSIPGTARPGRPTPTQADSRSQRHETLAPPYTPFTTTPSRPLKSEYPRPSSRSSHRNSHDAPPKMDRARSPIRILPIPPPISPILDPYDRKSRVLPTPTPAHNRMSRALPTPTPAHNRMSRALPTPTPLQNRMSRALPTPSYPSQSPARRSSRVLPSSTYATPVQHPAALSSDDTISPMKLMSARPDLPLNVPLYSPAAPSSSGRSGRRSSTHGHHRTSSVLPDMDGVQLRPNRSSRIRDSRAPQDMDYRASRTSRAMPPQDTDYRASRTSRALPSQDTDYRASRTSRAMPDADRDHRKSRTSRVILQQPDAPDYDHRKSRALQDPDAKYREKYRSPTPSEMYYGGANPNANVLRKEKKAPSPTTAPSASKHHSKHSGSSLARKASVTLFPKYAAERRAAPMRSEWYW